MGKTLEQIARERARSRHMGELASGAGGSIVVTQGKSKHHGGFLSHIPGSNIVAKTGSDLYHAAINTPAGLVYLGKGLATNPVGTGEDMVKATATDLRHPLRHPGYTLLDVLGIAGGAAGLAGRIGATGAALSRGATAGEVARAALTRGIPAARTLRSGGLEVKVPASKAPLTRAIQRGSDTLLHRAADKNPSGRAAALVNRKIGRAVTEQGRTREAIAKGPGAALVALGRKLQPHEQKALQIVAEEAPVDRRITAAAARVTGAKDPKARARHQHELDLLHQAKPLLSEVDGKPAFAGKTAGKLNGVLSKMRTVAGTREELLKGLGLLTDESIQSRKTDAARVALGATYEKPTPSKLGQETPGLARARKQRDVLQTRFDQMYEKQRGKLTNAPMTIQEAKAEHARLQLEHDRAVSDIAAKMFGPADRTEVNFRTRENRRALRQQSATSGGFSGRKSTLRPTLTEERRRHVERLIEQQIAKNPDHPTLKRWAERSARIDQLKTALEPEMFDKIDKKLLPAKQVFVPRTGKLDRIGGALSVAKERVQRLEQAAAGKVKPTGILGHEDFAASPDAVRVPDVARKPGKSSQSPPKTGIGGVVGRPKEPGSVTHGYTGALREHGVRRQDTAQLVGESGIEAGKFAALQHVVDLAKQAARPEPLRPNDIAVRLDNIGKGEKLPADVRRYLDDPHEFFQHATPAETNGVFDKVRQQLIVDPKRLTPEQAAEFQKLHAEGKIGFVPRAILGDFAKPQAPLSAVAGSKAVRSVDAINNASRFAILYLKPAYAIPNLLGNAALNLIQQGFAAPTNLARAVAVSWRIGPEAAARIDTLMGEGFARAVSAHGQGALSTSVDKAASVWSKGVDTPFRRAAFIHEARAAGYRSPAQLEQLLTDPAKHEELVHTTVRANREIIDYSALSPAEREIVRRIVFFYPWVKGSTRYAGHFVAEHPVGAAVAGQIGKKGHEETVKALGPVPSYLEGIFPVGKDKVSNPASAAILNTPAQVGAAIAGLLNGNVSQAAELSNFASPAMSLALAEIGRRNVSTGVAYPGKASGFDIAKDTLGSRLPQVSLYRNLKEAGSGKTSRRLYPPSVTSALEQFLVGGIAPRKINKNRLRALALQELRARDHAR